MGIAEKAVELVDKVFIKKVYEGYVFRRRTDVLSGHLSRLIPPNARVLDIGCGDGQVTAAIARRRQDITIEGIDILLRKKTFIPVTTFDGEKVPCSDASFDAVLLVDMLHHTYNKMIILKEACRITRQCIIIKDHMTDCLFAIPILRFMDWVGNARYQIPLVYSYWSAREWLQAFETLNLIAHAVITDVRIYPPPADWLFGRSLQFIIRLDLK